MLTIFVLGVLVGLLIGAFVWTALSISRNEEEMDKRIRIARRAWERESHAGRCLHQLAPTHPAFDRRTGARL